MEMESSSFYGGLMEQAACGYEYDEDRPVKQLRSWMPTTTTFQFDGIPTYDEKQVLMKPKDEEAAVFQSRSVPSLPSKLAEHSLAERKRREKLTQRFVALSALVPGLKKMDKASILEDAIEHMKRLEEKVKGLEEQARKRSMESLVFTINKDHADEHDFPLIRARFCDRELLISIHCHRGKGLFDKIVAQLENFQFSVVNSSLITYGDSSFSITLIAQKNEEEDNMNVEQLVKNLRGLLKLML